MDGIPICKPYQQQEIVGTVKFTDKDYEAAFMYALMDDIKFGIGAEIRHGEDKPRLVLLSFTPVPEKRNTIVENE